MDKNWHLLILPPFHQKNFFAAASCWLLCNKQTNTQTNRTSVSIQRSHLSQDQGGRSQGGRSQAGGGPTCTWCSRRTARTGWPRRRRSGAWTGRAGSGGSPDTWTSSPSSPQGSGGGGLAVSPTNTPLRWCLNCTSSFWMVMCIYYICVLHDVVKTISTNLNKINPKVQKSFLKW